MRLLAYTQDESKVVQLDLNQGQQVQLNFAVSDPGDMLNRRSPFSQTFKLPTSEVNNKYFEHFYEADISAGTFDSSKKARCHILDQGVLVMAGYLQLRSVSLSSQCYQVAVFSDAANLFQDTESIDLREVFVTDGVTTLDYDYTNTPANIVSSFNTSNDITGGTVGNGTIVIPLFDHGRAGADKRLHVNTTIAQLDNLAFQNKVFARRFKPAIKVKSLWDLIFDQHGYSYTSTFLTSARFARLYMMLGTNAAELEGRPFFGARIGFSADQAISSSGIYPLQLDTDTGADFYDPDDLWSTTQYTFTAPQNMIARFGGNIYVSRPSTGVTGQVAIRVYSGTQQYVTSYQTFGSSSVLLANFWLNPYQVEFNLQQGETVAVQVIVQDLSGGSLSAGVDATYGSNTYESNFRFVEYYAPGGDANIHTPSLMPDMTQAEFLKEIVNRFNLVLEASPDNERHLYIEPHADWLDSGAEVDWTGKLDLSKEVKLSPTNELRKKTIIYTDAEGKDESNVNRQEAHGHVFGEYREIVDDDFAQGEQKWESNFKPMHVHPMTGDFYGATEVPNMVSVHLYKIKESGEYAPIADKPFLFYHNGMQENGLTLHIETTSFTQYPYCSAFDEGPTTADTQSLYWDYQYPFGYGVPIVGEQYVNQNLVRAYWSRYINQIYHQDARVLEASFYLKPSDILNLRFNQLINVRGVHYRLLEVSGYAVNGYETTKCKLIKDQGTGQYVNTCGYIPDVWNIDGTIRFIDPDSGTTTYTPGEACCVEVGGVFDNSTGKCFWRTPRTGGQGGIVERDSTQKASPVPTSSESEQRVYVLDRQDIQVQRATFYASVNENRTAVATQDGDGTSEVTIPNNVVMQGRLMVSTTQLTNDGTNGAIGSADYIEYAISAQNVDGTSSVTLQEVSDARITDTSATGNRQVAASISGSELTLTCTGETYARVSFTIELVATYQDVSYAAASSDNMLTEAGDDLVFENSDHTIPG